MWCDTNSVHLVYSLYPISFKMVSSWTCLFHGERGHENRYNSKRHLAANDITVSSNPEEIFDKLLNLFDDLMQDCDNTCMFIGEILTRNPSQRHSPGFTKDEFDKQRNKINLKNYLKKKIEENWCFSRTFPFHRTTTIIKSILVPKRSLRVENVYGLEKYSFTIRRLFFSVI